MNKLELLAVKELLKEIGTISNGFSVAQENFNDIELHLDSKGTEVSETEARKLIANAIVAIEAGRAAVRNSIESLEALKDNVM